MTIQMNLLERIAAGWMKKNKEDTAGSPLFWESQDTGMDSETGALKVELKKVQKIGYSQIIETDTKEKP